MIVCGHFNARCLEVPFPRFAPYFRPPQRPMIDTLPLEARVHCAGRKPLYHFSHPAF